MSDVPQEKIGQYWCYTFEGLLKGNYAYFYGFSEEEAREKYKDHYGIEPGKLIERQPW